MATYCNSIPKYSQSIVALPAKPIAIVLKEHKQRYGDSTKNTAQSFQPTAKDQNSATHQEEEVSEPDSEDMVRAKVRAAWAELVANSSAGTGTVPSKYGNKSAGLYIREITLEESPAHETATAYPMPFETHLSDEELAIYRIEQQWKEQYEDESSYQQQMITNSTPEAVEQTNTNTINPEFQCPGWRLNSMQELWEKEKERAKREVNEILRSAIVTLGKQAENEPYKSPDPWQNFTAEEKKVLDSSEMLKFFAARGVKNQIQEANISKPIPTCSLEASQCLGQLYLDDPQLNNEDRLLNIPITVTDPLVLKANKKRWGCHQSSIKT